MSRAMCADVRSVIVQSRHWYGIHVEHIPMCEVMRVDCRLRSCRWWGGGCLRASSSAAAGGKTFGVNGVALASNISLSLKLHMQSQPIMNFKSSATNARILSASSRGLSAEAGLYTSFAVLCRATTAGVPPVLLPPASAPPSPVPAGLQFDFYVFLRQTGGNSSSFRTVHEIDK